jgi:hypothetical protein
MSKSYLSAAHQTGAALGNDDDVLAARAMTCCLIVTWADRLAHQLPLSSPLAPVHESREFLPSEPDRPAIWRTFFA